MSFDLKIQNGDLRLVAGGGVDTVAENSKLKQDLIKILLTQKGSVKYHRNYGSIIGALRVGHYTDENMMSMEIIASAKSAIKTLIAMQRAQERRQFLSPGEAIVEIRNVNVGRDLDDPRLYNISISVITRELTEVSEFITVRLT